MESSVSGSLGWPSEFCCVLLRKKLRCRKFGGTESNSPNFRTADRFLKMLGDLISSHSERHICTSFNKSKLNSFFHVNF